MKIGAFGRTLIRWTIKSLLFVVIVLLVLNPDVPRAIMQVDHTLHPERLIQTNFFGLRQINHEIDRLMASNSKKIPETKIVEKFVYKKIHYITDYDNWLNVEYWPTAEETWLRGQEDCDGRAILATSILRSRGYQSARLVVGLKHMWIQVDENEKFPTAPEKITALLSPEKNFSLAIRRNPDAGHFVRIARALINPTAIKDTGASLFGDIPATRKSVIILALLLLCYHPCRSFKGLLPVFTLGYASATVLGEWNINSGTWEELLLGMTLLGIAVVGALLMNRLGKVQFGFKRKLPQQPKPAAVYREPVAA